MKKLIPNGANYPDLRDAENLQWFSRIFEGKISSTEIDGSVMFPDLDFIKNMPPTLHIKVTKSSSDWSIVVRPSTLVYTGIVVQTLLLLFILSTIEPNEFILIKFLKYAFPTIALVGTILIYWLGAKRIITRFSRFIEQSNAVGE